MKLSLKKIDIVNALSSVVSVTGKKRARDEICLVLSSNGSEVEMFADNPEIYHTVYVKLANVKTEQKFSAFLNLESFSEILSLFDNEEEINFSLDEVNNLCKLSGNGAEGTSHCAVLKHGNLDDLFSQEDLDPNLYSVSMNPDVFKNAVNSVIDCVADVSASYKSITGAFFKFYSNNGVTKIDVVGTDNMVLAVNSGIQLEKDFGIQKEFILPKKSIMALLKLMSSKDDIKMSIKENSVVFKTNSATVLFHTINEKYPDYNSIMPSSFGHLLDFKADEFLKKLSKISTLVKFDECVKWHVSKDSSSLSLHGSKQYQATQKINDFSTLDDLSLNILVSHNSLNKTIKNIPSDIFRLCVSDATKPFVIKSVGIGDIQYVIMPSLR